MTIKTLVIAHRGASFYRPENTLSAFELGYQQGADGIEIDLHLSKDNVPMVIHDETVDRVTTEKGYVNQFTCQELKSMDIGSWFGKEYQDQRMLTLDEFLQWAKGKNLVLNLELKTDQIAYPNIEKIVYDEVVRHDMLDEIVVSSFNHKSLENLKEIDPKVKLAALSSNPSPALLHTCMTLGFDGVHLNYRRTNSKIVEQYHNENLYVAVWTVNNANIMKKYFQYGSEMIITDRPDLAIEVREDFEQ